MQSPVRLLGHLRNVPLVLALTAALIASGCSDGEDGEDGAPGAPAPPAPTDTVLTPEEDPPGVVLAIVALGGASGSDGTFQVGDRLAVNFTLKKDNGSDWGIAEMTTARMLVSGPTFNYQPVLEQVSDVATASVRNADGSYTYTFATPIPAAYLPPLNDTTAFGPGDGELAGQALLAGTYTLGAYFGWSYTVGSDSFRDVDNKVVDFQFGGSTVVDARAVVGQDNCNQCHTDLQAHGGLRRNITLCLLCHTTGSEDSTATGTSIDFKIMIHKLHNAAHLPSVLGVSTNTDGSRNYAATPQPYLIGGDDFSHVDFPVWPNGMTPMPRDEDYSLLLPNEQDLEDIIRSGASNCGVCHADPDGTGPITAPAQGDLHRTQPTRAACGSCHDDVNWTHTYTSNGQPMGAQPNDSSCIFCHPASNSSYLSVAKAHTHPLDDSAFNAGLDIVASNVVEAGLHNSNDKIDPGEKIGITLTIQDDAGADVAPSALSSMSTVISGPTSNYNILLNASFPPDSLTGSQPFSVNVPQQVALEFVTDSTAVLGETFTTRLVPHWTPTSDLTTVFIRTGLGVGSSTLAFATAPPTNFIDVADATGFDHNDYVVIDDGVLGFEEYLRVQHVDGARLWFSSPSSTSYVVGPRLAHSFGANVREVTLAAATEGTHYTVNAATGTITEVVEFGINRAVIISYTTDFVMPAVFPVALNGSPDVGESSGKWTGLSIAAGTYTLGIWGQVNLSLALEGETNSYRSVSPSHNVDFLVGSATTIEPYDLISSGANCNACHQELYFHGGGRRGYDTCVLCHGTAGSEDRPQYVAANAPPTTAASINFRTMLHKIHMGRDLANASDYELVGFGSGAWPDNFSTHDYADVGFPSMRSGVGNCGVCHGESMAWIEPAPRDHPLGQDSPTKSWSTTCGACHDSDASQAHIDVQTSSSGQESCAVCHGKGSQYDVSIVHKPR